MSQGLRITKDVDPIPRELVADHVQFLRALDRPIYMDGRPHPPEWAPHTWAGFSTGTYDVDEATNIDTLQRVTRGADPECSRPRWRALSAAAHPGFGWGTRAGEVVD